MRRCLVVIALAVGVGGATSSGAAAATDAFSGTAPARADAVVTVTVIATEFKFRLSKSVFARGTTVAFKLINRGQIVHDFKVKGFLKKTPVIAPGKQYTLRLTFKKAGRYTYLCTVPRHAQDGMSGTIRIR